MSKEQPRPSITAEEQARRIRAEMVCAGVKSVDIAEAEQVVPNYVYFVLYGKRKGYRIRRAIAKAVGKPVEQLWPDTPPQHRSAA